MQSPSALRVRLQIIEDPTVAETDQGRSNLVTIGMRCSTGGYPCFCHLPPIQMRRSPWQAVVGGGDANCPKVSQHRSSEGQKVGHAGI